MSSPTGSGVVSLGDSSQRPPSRLTMSTTTSTSPELIVGVLLGGGRSGNGATRWSPQVSTSSCARNPRCRAGRPGAGALRPARLGLVRATMWRLRAERCGSGGAFAVRKDRDGRPSGGEDHGAGPGAATGLSPHRDALGGAALSRHTTRLAGSGLLPGAVLATERTGHSIYLSSHHRDQTVRPTAPATALKISTSDEELLGPTAHTCNDDNPIGKLGKNLNPIGAIDPRTGRTHSVQPSFPVLAKSQPRTGHTRTNHETNTRTQTRRHTRRRTPAQTNQPTNQPHTQPTNPPRHSHAQRPSS